MSVSPQASRNSNFGFWRPRRPIRAIDPVTRCRPIRLRTSAILKNPVRLTVKLEVEKFKFCGNLRRTQTQVHNSLPSSETIETEKTLMSFEERRRNAPETVLYGDFYRSLTSSITPLPSRAEVLRSSRISSRGPDTPKTTTFPHWPSLSSQGMQLLSSPQSVVSRVVTSYGRRPGQKFLEDLRPAEGSGMVLSSRGDSREFSRAAQSEPNSHRYLDLDESQSSLSSRV